MVASGGGYGEQRAGLCVDNQRWRRYARQVLVWFGEREKVVGEESEAEEGGRMRKQRKMRE
jgi:hypothetical protein